MKKARKRRNLRPVCKWCGAIKQAVGWHTDDASYKKRVCVNLDCPRRGQVPWVVPQMMPIGRRATLAHRHGEDDPGFEDAVRVLEDRANG